jgi:Fission yeast centromere protein N-terminal domain/Tc5 transposase DNA-binding domain
MPRKAVSHSEKKALRAFYYRQQPRPSQKALIAWFKQTYNRTLSQSTISEYLSDHYKYLDNLDPQSFSDQFALQSRRQRESKWPTLEKILFQWHCTIESRGGTITGDLLVEKAHEIWQQLPEYRDSQERPEFSDGWLTRFKKRHHIKQRTHHGEAADVPSSAEDEMRAVRTLCGDYKEEDIYNMDETGLFWRQSPSSGLTTQAKAGRKKDKNRIILTLCTNYTGSDRLPVWFIGRA